MLWNDRNRQYDLTDAEQDTVRILSWVCFFGVITVLVHRWKCDRYRTVHEVETNTKEVDRQLAFLQLAMAEGGKLETSFEERREKAGDGSRGPDEAGDGSDEASDGCTRRRSGVGVGTKSGETGDEANTGARPRLRSVHTVELPNHAAAASAPKAYLSGSSFSFHDIEARLEKGLRSDDGELESSEQVLQGQEQITGLLQRIVMVEAEVGRGEFSRAGEVQLMQNQVDRLRLEQIAALYRRLRETDGSKRRARFAQDRTRSRFGEDRARTRTIMEAVEQETGDAVQGFGAWVENLELVHHVRTTSGNKSMTVALLLCSVGTLGSFMYSIYTLYTKGSSVAGELFMVLVLATLMGYMLYYVALKWYYDWYFAFELEFKYMLSVLCCQKLLDIDDKELVDAFNVLDVDGNGTISGGNLEHVMEQLGHYLRPHEARKMIRDLSSRGDVNTLDFEEFKLVVKSKGVRSARDMLRPILVKVVTLHGLLGLGLLILLQGGWYFNQKEYIPETTEQITLTYPVGGDSITDSLVLNQDCSFSSYFDNHDMWHFLSGLALFFFAIVVACIEHPDFVIQSTSDQLVVF